MKEYIPLQAWECRKCGGRGDVEMPADTDFWSGYTRVVDAHREASDDCHEKWGVQFVRVSKPTKLPKNLTGGEA